jgi:hypothetical protein
LAINSPPFAGEGSLWSLEPHPLIGAEEGD